MERARRQVSPKLKFQVVLEALADDKTLGQIAKAYGVHPSNKEDCGVIQRGEDGMSARWSRISGVFVVALGVFLISGGGSSGPVSTLAAGTPQIYVAELSQILRVDDITGADPRTLGDSGRDVGQFGSPRGIFVDGAGRIYVADCGNHRICFVQ